MPYGRTKRSNKRSSASSVTKIARRRPTASNQKKQIMSLSSKVNKLSKKVVDTTQYVQYQHDWFITTSANYAIRDVLADQNRWTSVFNTARDNVNESNKFNVTSVKMDCQITPGNEADLVTQTYFLVSPRNQKVVEETTNMTVLVNGVDYVIFNGLAYMNKKRFTIHRYKTSLTGGDQYTYQPQSHRFYWSLPWKKQIKSANSTWLTVTEEELSATSKLYFINFTDNIGADLQYPLLNASILISGYA